MVVELDVTQQCTGQVFGIAKAMRRQHVGNTAVETLHHAIGLRSSRRRQPMFDSQRLAQLVELMAPRGLAFTVSKPA